MAAGDETPENDRRRPHTDTEDERQQTVSETKTQQHANKLQVHNDKKSYSTKKLPTVVTCHYCLCFCLSFHDGFNDRNRIKMGKTARDTRAANTAAAFKRITVMVERPATRQSDVWIPAESELQTPLTGFLFHYLVFSISPICWLRSVSSMSCFCRIFSLPTVCLMNTCCRRSSTLGLSSKSLIRHLRGRRRHVCVQNGCWPANAP